MTLNLEYTIYDWYSTPRDGRIILIFSYIRKTRIFACNLFLPTRGGDSWEPACVDGLQSARKLGKRAPPEYAFLQTKGLSIITSFEFTTAILRNYLYPILSFF